MYFSIASSSMFLPYSLMHIMFPVRFKSRICMPPVHLIPSVCCSFSPKAICVVLGKNASDKIVFSIFWRVSPRPHYFCPASFHSILFTFSSRGVKMKKNRRLIRCYATFVELYIVSLRLRQLHRKMLRVDSTCCTTAYHRESPVQS